MPQILLIIAAVIFLALGIFCIAIMAALVINVLGDGTHEHKETEENKNEKEE